MLDKKDNNEKEDKETDNEKDDNIMTKMKA